MAIPPHMHRGTESSPVFPARRKNQRMGIVSPSCQEEKLDGTVISMAAVASFGLEKPAPVGISDATVNQSTGERMGFSWPISWGAG